MAVYYKWIKGCAPGATLDDGQWSYISWGTSNKNNTDALPTLKITNGKKDISNVDNVTDLGYFLTNKVNQPEIYKQWYFKEGIKLSDGVDITYGASGILLRANTLIYGKLTTLGAEVQYNFTAGETTINETLNVKKATTLDSTLTVTGNTTINNPLTVTSSCTATYFNATSDKRAKENIRPANYSALDLIKKLPVYIYNYKNNNETVTGILAQDLLEVQPKELNLVSNINATGENNDYMSIKNDKLMFVLMKAIQEQQEQIEQLKSEIDNIKKSY